jgi:hypothetical protein
MTMSLTQAKLTTSWWSDADFSTLLLACLKIGCKAEDLWLVMCSESEVNPASLNWCKPDKPGCSGTYINAAGLNQLTRVAALSAGLITAKDDFQVWAKKVAASPIADQLANATAYFLSTPWSKAGHGYESALRLYLANAAPSLLYTNLKNGTTPIYMGDAAAQNSARSSIGDLQAGLNFWKQKPLFEAGQVRLNALFAF